MTMLMKILSLAGLLLILALASCQPTYFYHFPKESEVRAIAPDSLKWKYSGSSISQIPVADDGGTLYWLEVTDKTKVLIKSILGEEYKFYLRTITTDNSGGGIYGPDGMWTGYDLHDHVRRTVLAREINSISIIAESPATHRIPR